MIKRCEWSVLKGLQLKWKHTFLSFRTSYALRPTFWSHGSKVQWGSPSPSMSCSYPPSPTPCVPHHITWLKPKAMDMDELQVWPFWRLFWALNLHFSMYPFQFYWSCGRTSATLSCDTYILPRPILPSNDLQSVQYLIKLFTRIKKPA